MALGGLLVSAGAVVGLYVLYALVLTGQETAAAQAELRESWVDPEAVEASDEDDGDAQRGTDRDDVHDERDAEDEQDAEDDDGAEDAEAPQDGVALLEVLTADGEPGPLDDDPYVVVEGVTYDDLTRGPGHYPHSAQPGEEGNVAVAGHRTTYGSPFFHLDAVSEGDRIEVTDREGQVHRYEVREQRVVQPSDTWVVEDDPLDTGEPTLTLTTCHPRFSAAERLIVFAELVETEGG